MSNIIQGKSINIDILIDECNKIQTTIEEKRKNLINEEAHIIKKQFNLENTEDAMQFINNFYEVYLPLFKYKEEIYKKTESIINKALQIKSSGKTAMMIDIKTFEELNEFEYD